MSNEIIRGSSILYTSGFEEVKANTIIRNLNKVNPTGGTAFRDAALLGTSHIL
jgi:hypothetical protein